MKQTINTTLPRLNATSLSQYVRLENCERFLRFRLRHDEEKAMLKRWGLTIQPLTPLLKESGFEFERSVTEQIASRGEPVVDLDKQGVEITADWLRRTREPVILLQPSLEGLMGNYACHGRADVIRLQRNRKGALRVLIADVKASRHERMEHRLQVAVYAHMIQAMAAHEGIQVTDMQGSVLHVQEDGSIPPLDPEAPTFDLDTYLTILDHLAIEPDCVVNRVASLPFEELAYHLSYKCDGCAYNAVCMYDSAERLDISLVPYLSPVEKRVLRDAGIKVLPQLAALMDLPARESGERDLRAAPGQEALIGQLANQWPVGPNLPLLVQRARRALKRFDTTIESTTFIYNAGFGTLPSEEDHPKLIKVFFDAQYDYLGDRVYMISALVAGPRGERVVVHCTPEPPGEESERDLLMAWVMDVLRVAREVSAGDQAPVHLYCYNRYDQKVLLEALKRHLEQVATLPAFFDLMTQSPALEQSIISFLSSELEERRNLGPVCTPLHDAARMLGFDWSDESYEYYRLFRARLFDNRRNVIRQVDGRLVPVKSETKDAPDNITIEAASRFNSQIPLEYAYGAWGCLPEDQEGENNRVLDQFRQVTLDQLKAFAGHRVRALAHIEGSFKKKARWLPKPDLHLPALGQPSPIVSPLSQGLQEFLYMEHHAAFQAKLLNYSLPIERRVQTGLALLLRYQDYDQSSGHHRFAIEFESIGLNPVLTMNAFRLKEGGWVVINEAAPPLSAGRIKNGRLAVIQAVGPDWIALDLLDVTFRQSKFRYYHNTGLVPQPGALYTLDEMADDLIADKCIEALVNAGGNTLYRWLLKKPGLRAVDKQAGAFTQQFVNLVDTIEKPHKLTSPQREVVAEHLAEPLFLVQGPPGTGKSHTLAWAVLCRLAICAAQGRPCRIAVSCKTHNAINVTLEALAQKWQRLTGFFMPLAGGRTLASLQIYKVVNDESEPVPARVKPLKAYNRDRSWPRELEDLLQQPLLVIGSTPGGLYNLMKYRAAGDRSVDWSLKTFDLVVIDEASQMSLPEAVLACAFLQPEGNVIVVGDHRQMPPIIAHAWEDEEKRTVTATKPYLSLFESLVERDFPRVALDESFRLHKVMADFLQENIYVHDGIRFFSRRKEILTQPPPFDSFVDTILDPQYPIVVVEHAEQRSQQYNQAELELITPLIDVCANRLGLTGKDGIGVVVPHRAQKAILRERFPGLAVTDSIDTVERFQGGERDVIIVSATASDPDYVLAEADFLLNLNRLNVALSRPRKKLIVVASRSVVDLLTSDLDVFENAVIWKRLYYQCANDVLWQGDRYGVPVWLRGKRAE